MRDAAAARKWLPVIALGLVPLLFHTAIVASNYEPLGFVTPFGQWFKLGLVTASAVMHWTIYSSLLLTFALTLRPGHEPLISTMTRRMHGPLSDEVTVYTRRVTIAWCGFFAAQLVTSISLFFFAPIIIWSFFVNILDIPLVAAMFAAEYAVRGHCLRHPPRETLAVIVTMVANARKPHGEAAGSR
jgi:uncharacterized membrane protein